MELIAPDRIRALTSGEPVRRSPCIVAQGGNAAEFPENTLPALRSALELGIEYLEIDVQLTADRVPVVANDHLLAGTTGAHGNILELRAEELLHVRASEPARFGNRFTDVGIPTLAQAVQLLAAFPAAIAFIDIQSTSLQHHGHRHVIDRIARCLHTVRNQVVLITSELTFVEVIRQRGEYRAGWKMRDYSSLSALKCDAIAPEFLCCEQSNLPADLSRLWRGPWNWIISEVASGTQALQLSARGASFVQTTKVRSLLRELRHLASVRG